MCKSRSSRAGLGICRFLVALLAFVLCTSIVWPQPARAEVGVWVGPYPTLRARLGPGGHLTLTDFVRRPADFALDLSAGLPIVILPPGSSELLDRMVVLYPELGYAYQSSGQHLFTAGTLVGYGKGFLFGSYGMRFVGGKQGDFRALGLRHGVGIHFVFDIFSIELEHQALWAAGKTQHDLILWFGLNLIQYANMNGKIR